MSAGRQGAVVGPEDPVEVLAAALVRSLRTLIADAARDAVREALAEQRPEPAPPTADALLSTAEAARIAGVATKTIRAWVAAGRLRSMHAGRQLRIARPDLERCLAEPGADKIDPDAIASRLLRRTGTGG